MTSEAAEVPGPRPNATAAALLGLLLDRPMTGWDLMSAAQERIGEFWTITQSQVYRELTAMAARGLIAAGPPGPRERKPYEVTAAGRTAFAEWLESGPGEDHPSRRRSPSVRGCCLLRPVASSGSTAAPWP